MTLETVRSSAIHAIGYDAGHRMMEVIFTGGGIYQFSNVPPHVFAGFRASASKGNYFQEHVRGHFRHQRLGRFRQLRSVAMQPSGPV